MSRRGRLPRPRRRAAAAPVAPPRRVADASTARSAPARNRMAPAAQVVAAAAPAGPPLELVESPPAAAEHTRDPNSLAAQGPRHQGQRGRGHPQGGGDDHRHPVLVRHARRSRRGGADERQFGRPLRQRLVVTRSSLFPSPLPGERESARASRCGINIS